MLIGDRLIGIANSYFETISYWTEKVGLRHGKNGFMAEKRAAYFHYYVNNIYGAPQH